jgi:hypothetical protein
MEPLVEALAAEVRKRKPYCVGTMPGVYRSIEDFERIVALARVGAAVSFAGNDNQRKNIRWFNKKPIYLFSFVDYVRLLLNHNRE